MQKIPCANCKKECLSELVGTYLLVFVGPASVIIFSALPSLYGLKALILIALTFAGTVAALIFTLGKHSGAIINPAITLAAMSARLLRKGLLAPYLFFQLLGGVLAGLSLRIFFISFQTKTELGSTALTKGVDPLVGITIEAMGTFVLASSALIASTRIRGSQNQAIFVGSTLFILIIFIGPLTGAGFNPARSLGPSLASGYTQNLYVYIVGPILGALAAGLVFRVIRKGGEGKAGNSVCMC